MMRGLYKTAEKLFLFEFAPYSKIEWRVLLDRKNKIAPRIFFEKKGVLLIYDLKDCRFDDHRIYYKGREVQLLQMSKSR